MPEDASWIARRVVHHASVLPSSYHPDGPDVFRLTVEELREIVVSALHEAGVEGHQAAWDALAAERGEQTRH